MKPAFIYARVSTTDKEQDPRPQLIEMMNACSLHGWPHESFVDEVSSGKRRPELEKMLAKAYRGECSVILCRHFDRIARSTRELLEILDELRARNVDFISLNQQVDTTTPHGKLLFTMIAAFAEFERSMIRERVNLGLAAARARGTRLGRPRRVADALKIHTLRSTGASWRAIGKETGVSPETARRIFRNSPNGPKLRKLSQKPVQKPVQKSEHKKRTDGNRKTV
jgi:DNA invertase Pin-like site-specific DNA recombinase